MAFIALAHKNVSKKLRVLMRVLKDNSINMFIIYQ